MKLQLIQGEFEAKEALELLSQLIQVKIKFHESKIAPETSEEDMKNRESKIKRLQNELHELRKYMQLREKKLILEALIEIKE